MDLKLKDVADLLNVTETTIQQLLSAGEIPAYKIKDQYLFSRVEIENWVLNHKLTLTINEKNADQTKNYLNNKSDKALKTPTKTTRRGAKQFSLYRAIHKGDCLHKVEGKTKEEVIRAASKLIAKELQFDADVITELLLDRENLQPTSLNNGVGIPHPRDFLLHTTNDVVTIVFPENPIEYGALDGIPVNTLFFLFACQDKNHLHLLAKIAHFCNCPDRVAFLNTKPSKKELLNYVKDWESSMTAQG